MLEMYIRKIISTSTKLSLLNEKSHIERKVKVKNRAIEISQALLQWNVNGQPHIQCNFLRVYLVFRAHAHIQTRILYSII